MKRKKKKKGFLATWKTASRDILEQGRHVISHALQSRKLQHKMQRVTGARHLLSLQDAAKQPGPVREPRLRLRQGQGPGQRARVHRGTVQAWGAAWGRAQGGQEGQGGYAWLPGVHKIRPNRQDLAQLQSWACVWRVCVGGHRVGAGPACLHVGLCTSSSGWTGRAA